MKSKSSAALPSASPRAHSSSHCRGVMPSRPAWRAAQGQWMPCVFALWLTSGLWVTSAVAEETPGGSYSLYVPADSWDPGMINPPKCLGTSQEGLQIGSLECDSDEHKNFMDGLHHWRAERRHYVGYDGSRYDSPALKWTQSNFIQPQTMVEDRYFYDPVAGKYTVDRYLDDALGLGRNVPRVRAAGAAPHAAKIRHRRSWSAPA